MFRNSMQLCHFCWATALVIFALAHVSSAQAPTNRRARDLGVDVGILPVGEWNAITDVPGVQVGHHTIKGDNACTGVTIVLPHPGNIFQRKVPAAIYVGNGFGKLAGSTQVAELGTIETPIGLTNTLSVPVVTEAIVKHTLRLPGNENVRSVNAVVGETNDGYLNDIRALHVTTEHVQTAIQNCKSGWVAEGAVGAGTGTVCFGFKGGIGTSSRVLPESLGGHKIGVLVQTNYGGILAINGAPVGRELGTFAFSRLVNSSPDGSCMIVIATDAPVSPRNLKRLAKRSMFGLARTGSIMSNGSGDYAIAFSTAPIASVGEQDKLISNREMTPLFLAVMEATEEAIYNSMFAAESVTGRDGRTVPVLPVDKTISVLKKYGLLNLNDRLPSLK